LIKFHKDTIHRQRSIEKKNQINVGIKSTKEMLGKLTGVEVESEFYPIDEELIEESLENINMLLAMQNKP